MFLSRLADWSRLQLMTDTFIRTFSSIALVLLFVAAWSAEEMPEAPLEDVWPTLSEPRFGDLDAMVKHGEIRVLTSFTLGSYYIDRGRQRGTV